MAARPNGTSATDAQESIPPDYPRITFTDVTDQAGIHFKHFHGARTTQLPEDMGSGAAWGDFDNDGFPDGHLRGLRGRQVGSPEAPRSHSA